ncbi:MAG: hypothetical protein ABFS03_00905 [Chloroflexota bacterium]
MIEFGPSIGPGIFIFFREEIEYAGGIEGAEGDVSESEDKRVYETLPLETVKSLEKKVSAYKATEKVEILPQESVESIISTMVDIWPESDMKMKMAEFDLSQELAIIRYRETLRVLINDDDLALILILANV